MGDITREWQVGTRFFPALNDIAAQPAYHLVPTYLPTYLIYLTSYVAGYYLGATG